MKHIIALLFIFIDIIVFAGVSWTTANFSPPPNTTPDAAPTIEFIPATTTLPTPGTYFSDIKRLP